MGLHYSNGSAWNYNFYSPCVALVPFMNLEDFFFFSFQAFYIC